MFVPDIPDLPQQYTPVMMVDASSALVQGSSAQKERILGVCQPVPNYTGSDTGGDHIFDPASSAVNYLWFFESDFKSHTDKARNFLYEAESAAQVTILQQPRHGELVDEGEGGFLYVPQPGYFGEDGVVVQVSIAGYRVKVIYSFQAVNRDLGSNWEKELCGKKGYQWKISLASTTSGTTSIASLLSFTGIDGPRSTRRLG